MNTKHFLNLCAGNIFGTQPEPPIPTKYYLGLSKTLPNEDGGNVEEPDTAAGYKRIELTNLSKPNNGVVTNEKAINFDESTQEWGKVTYFVVYDNATPKQGNLLMWGALSSARTVETATILTIKEGALKLSVLNPSA